MTYPAAAQIEVLKIVRLLLDRGQEEFICHALDNVGQLHPNLEELCDALGRYVQGALWYGPKWAYTFGQWLPFQVPGYMDLGTLGKMNIAYLGRLAWVDKMIYDLETKGALP